MCTRHVIIMGKTIVMTMVMTVSTKTGGVKSKSDNDHHHHDHSLDHDDRCPVEVHEVPNAVKLSVWKPWLRCKRNLMFRRTTPQTPKLEPLDALKGATRKGGGGDT